MATPKTVATYDLNGSLREFDFAFDYLARSFVQVTLIGAGRQVLAEGTGYSFVSSTRIRTSEAFSPPQWTQIEIRRVTSATERLVDFQDASILRADDLNLSDLQVLHIAEEAREAATETIGTNSEGMLDARGRRIVNLANPVDPGDAVSRLFYDTDKNGALAARNEAVAARNGALTSQQAAADSQTAARASEVAAKASQDAAKASQDAAKASQDSAAASQVASKSSENAARASENAARASQTAAATSQVAAKVSEDAAKVSQTAAAGSESRARTSEVNAKSSETSSAASMASASASMNSAESYKTAAAASQVAAKVSEDAASASKDSAQASSILSRKWATNPENVEVSGGEFSALHWSKKAETWAAQAGAVPLAVQQVSAAVRSLYQGFIGVPIPWPSESIPAGYLPLDGRAFDTAANPVLAQKYPLGTLPDLRRMFIRGSGAGFLPLSTQSSANLSHTHGVTVDSGGGHGHTGSASSGGGHAHSVSGTAALAGDHTHALPAYGGDGPQASHSGGGSTGAGAATKPTRSSGGHSHSVSGTAAWAGDHTHSVTIASGGAHTHTGSATASGESESRPMNTAFMYICMTDAAIPALPSIGT